MSFHFLSHQWEVQYVPDGTLVVFTQRDLDPANVHEMVDELYEIARESNQPNLYLDFGQVHRLASIVIGKLISLEQKLHTIGGRLVVKNVDPHVSENFEAAGVAEVLDIEVNQYQSA